MNKPPARISGQHTLTEALALTLKLNADALDEDPAFRFVFVAVQVTPIFAGRDASYTVAIYDAEGLFLGNLGGN